MTREGALLVMVGVAVVLLGLMLWGWRRRVRRDAVLTAPFGVPSAEASVRASFPVLYVATTAHGRPLERLAIRGLGYRARATADVTTAGLVLALDGQDPILLDLGRIESVGQSSVVIDRVVERDGLTRVSWRIRDDLVVDSFLRPQDASAPALADALAAILPSPASPTTESDA